MAVNPMQRRARNSMIIGIILGLVVAAIVAAMLLVLLSKKNDELKEEKEKAVELYVSAKDIKADEEITSADLVPATVITTLSRENVIGPDNLLEPSSLDKPTNNFKKVKVSSDDLTIRAQSIKLAADTTVGIQSEGTTESNQTTGGFLGNTQSTTTTGNSNVNTNSNATSNSTNDGKGRIKAKINIPKGTIITRDMINLETNSGVDENLLRLVEYETIVLPSEIEDKDTVDIRISYPSGKDQIVLGKKIVEKVDEETIWLKVDEHEILRLSSAIVEAFLEEGAKVYAVNYTDPGKQEKPKYNYYAVNSSVANLIVKHDDIMNKILKGEQVDLTKQVTGDYDGLTSKLEDAIKRRQEKRKTYYENLTSGTTSTTLN